MKIENTKAQMRKGILEYCILLSIRDEAKYANEIINQLKKNDLIVVEGTLYPLLTRLRKAKLLDYEWIESSSGPPRKYYKISLEGLDFIEELAKTWKTLKSAVENIVNLKKES